MWSFLEDEETTQAKPKGAQTVYQIGERKDCNIIDRRCPVSEQTPEEEVFNVLSHGTGALLAILGFLHIWEHHGEVASFLEMAILIIYGIAWLVLYGCSTLYHASRHLERKAYLRILDHCAIFVVIAASYGPFVLHILNDSRGYVIWALSWVIALGGCIFKFRSEHRYHAQSTWAYVVQGWMVTLTLPALIAGLSTSGFLWLLLGGVCLTGGIYFYIRDDVKYNHAAWHLCVLIGSLGFYLAVLDILPK